MTQLPTAQDVARMTEAAVAASKQAAERIREVGRTCLEMGQMMNDECQVLARDFENHANETADAVRDFAEKICARAQDVKKMSDDIHGVAHQQAAE